MKLLYLIPARGGSKGIPHKNIKQLSGKPLIAYSIDVARQLTDDCNICISTDDDEIIQVVTSYGLTVPFKRPDFLATDLAGTYEVILHAIGFYENLGISYDAVVLLQPTSPLRTAQQVMEAIGLYDKSVDAVVSVCESLRIHIIIYLRRIVMDIFVSQREMEPLGDARIHLLSGCLMELFMCLM